MEGTLSEELVAEAITNKVLIKDSHGRLHFIIPRSGPLHLTLRSQRMSPVSIQSNANDLYEFFTGASQHSIVMTVDGGTDYHTNHWKNMLLWYTVWEKLGLYDLVMVRNAPKLSAFNFIERKWAAVTNRLACVMLDVGVDGDPRPPSTCTELSRSRDVRVFVAAMSSSCRFVPYFCPRPDA